jgi:hypothetical protein
MLPEIPLQNLFSHDAVDLTSPSKFLSIQWGRHPGFNAEIESTDFKP